MKEAKKLSRVGFGSYRVSVKSAEHHKALQEALQLGLNLIDTSANYCDGESELLIGKILKDSAQKPFIITKAGYIQGKNLSVLKELQASGKALNGVVDLGEELKHSIHPDFLHNQLHLSLERLGVDSIDAYLLHNPEYFFKQKENNSQAQYYKQIKEAFQYLETQVEKGLIGSYGISSNTFPFPPENAECTNLEKILQVTAEMGPKHHFKYIQFPYNLIENGAALKHHGGKSLIDIARENKIITIANRPFNAFSAEGLIRLATYESFHQVLDENDIQDIFNLSFKLIRERWNGLNVETKFEQIPLLTQFKNIWRELPTPDAVDQVFFGHFFPFLAQLWGGQVPKESSKPFYLLYETALALTREKMSDRARQLRQDFVAKGILNHDQSKTLTQVLCQKYLDDGIDHVLVGMKRVDYVTQLKDFFKA